MPKEGTVASCMHVQSSRPPWGVLETGARRGDIVFGRRGR